MEKLIQECLLELAIQYAPWRTKSNFTEHERISLMFAETRWNIITEGLAMKLKAKGITPVDTVTT